MNVREQGGADVAHGVQRGPTGQIDGGVLQDVPQQHNPRNDEDDERPAGQVAGRGRLPVREPQRDFVRERMDEGRGIFKLRAQTGMARKDGANHRLDAGQKNSVHHAEHQSAKKSEEQPRAIRPDKHPDGAEETNHVAGNLSAASRAKRDFFRAPAGLGRSWTWFLNFPPAPPAQSGAGRGAAVHGSHR